MLREQRTWIFLSPEVFRRIERAASWGQLAVRRVRIPQIRAGELLKTVHHSATS